MIDKFFPKGIEKAVLKNQVLNTGKAYEKVAGSGYEIQVAADKNFMNILAEQPVTAGKTVKIAQKIPGASAYKGATLYVRVRAYFTYKDVTVYGSWSKVKSFKAK